MNKQDFSYARLYQAILYGSPVYVDKNIFNVQKAYNFMDLDGAYIGSFISDGTAIEIDKTFEIVDYDDNCGIQLRGALLSGSPILLIGTPRLVEVNHDGRALYNFFAIDAQGEIRYFVKSDVVPAITGDVFSLKRVAP